MNFGRTPELVPAKTPQELRDLFTAAFADLDANPRKSGVRFRAEELVIDVDQGDPVFILGGKKCRADLGGRWLPEHPVPLKFPGDGVRTLRFVPTTGGRIKVRG